VRILFAWLLLAAAPLLAHHSLAAEFDSSKPITLRGKITKVEWMNPHVYVWIDVVDFAGKVTNWRVESAAPNYLRSLGWTKDTVKPGDSMTIQAYISKDQPNLAKMDVAILADGRRLTVGRPDDRREATPSP
jgi:hypothetical protein